MNTRGRDGTKQRSSLAMLQDVALKSCFLMVFRLAFRFNCPILNGAKLAHLYWEGQIILFAIIGDGSGKGGCLADMLLRQKGELQEMHLLAIHYQGSRAKSSISRRVPGTDVTLLGEIPSQTHKGLQEAQSLYAYAHRELGKLSQGKASPWGL